MEVAAVSVAVGGEGNLATVSGFQRTALSLLEAPSKVLLPHVLHSFDAVSCFALKIRLIAIPLYVAEIFTALLS